MRANAEASVMRARCAASAGPSPNASTSTTSATSGSGRVGMMGMAVPAGVVAGAMVTGMPGAVWADQDNNGQVDGYVQGGRYMAGAPAGYSGQSMNTMPDPAPMATKKPYTAPVRSGERG